MTLRRLFIALVVLVAVAASAFGAEGDWTMTRYDETQSGYTPAKLSLPLSLSWQFNATKFDNNPSTPAVAGGMVFFASGDRINAIDAATGELKWQYPSGDAMKASIKTGITVWNGIVIFGATDGNVFGLDAATGRAMWAFATQRSVRSTPIVYNEIVYVGSDDNSLYALDPKTGQQVWGGPFKTKDDVNTSPAIASDNVIFSSMDANVYGANPASGRMRWAFQMPLMALKGGPVVSGSLVFLGSGRQVSVLSTKNGQLRYNISLESDCVTPLAMAGNDLFVICRNKKIYCYNVGLAGYQLKWAQPISTGFLIDTPPTIADKVMFVAGGHGIVSAYSTEDGKLLWRYTIAPSIIGNNNKLENYTSVTAPLVVADGALFVLSNDGAMHCFRPTGADQTPPRIYNLRPQSGVAINGFPPLTVSAILYDESSGVDESSIQLLLDNEKKDFVYDPNTLTVSWDMPITQPLQKLSDGRHNLTIIAKDWRGNELKHTWSLMINNSLPARPLPKAKSATAKKPGSSGSKNTQQPSLPGGPPTPDSGSFPPPPPMPGGPSMPGR